MTYFVSSGGKVSNVYRTLGPEVVELEGVLATGVPFLVLFMRNVSGDQRLAFPRFLID